jgi:hypothetical protein
MGVQIAADRGEFVGIAFDALDVGHLTSIQLGVIYLQERKSGRSA